MNYQEQTECINSIKGTYHHKSPYHKNKKLPFIITGGFFSNDYPVECIVIEYKGWSKNTILTGYTIESIRDKLSSGRFKFNNSQTF
jgi:hypothetical protein